MKKISLYFMLVFSVFACTSIEEQNTVAQEVEEQNSLTNAIEKGYQARLSKSHLEFSGLSRTVTHCLSNKTELKGQDCLEVSGEFIQKSGFPHRAFEVDSWSVSWQKADKMYHNFYNQNHTHPYIDKFRWHASQVILADLELLGDKSPEAIDKIAFYTQEMIEAGSDNLDFLYYCFNKLAQTKYARKINTWAKTALKRFENSGIQEMQNSYDKLKKLENEGKANAAHLQVLQGLEKYLSTQLGAQKAIQKMIS